MADTRAGAHHLYIACFRPALITEAVSVRNRASADIGDDFHIVVRVWRKACARADLVVVPDPERTMAHTVRVIVSGKGKMIARVQPVIVKTAERRKTPDVDHL